MPVLQSILLFLHARLRSSRTLAPLRPCSGLRGSGGALDQPSSLAGHMAPKSPSKSLSSADNTDNNIDKDKPSWDTSPITKPGYLVTLCRWLPAQDENHRLLVERGVTMYKQQTVVVSVNHMDRHRHGLLPKGTFQKPTIVLPGDNSLVGLPAAEALTAARAAYEKRAVSCHVASYTRAVGRCRTRAWLSYSHQTHRSQVRSFRAPSSRLLGL